MRISVKEYAAQNVVVPQLIYRLLSQGRLLTAKRQTRIGEWTIDEEEKLPTGKVGAPKKNKCK